MSALAESLGVDASALPSPRDEAWRTFPLRALVRRSFAASAPTALAAEAAATWPSPRLVFANGAFDAGSSDIALCGDALRITQLPADAQAEELRLSEDPGAAGDVFAHLATRAAGVIVEVQATLPAPLHILHVGTALPADHLWHQRIVLHLAPGVHMRLLERGVVAGDCAHLANVHMAISVSDGAMLEHLCLQDSGPAMLHFDDDAVEICAGAHYRRLDLMLEGAQVRRRLLARLVGDGARIEADGVQLGHGRRHVEARLDVQHRANNTASRLRWRGLGAGRSRVVLHGGLEISAGADGSDAQLQSRNLLLSEGARVDAQPVLVIHADEVTAAHGATVGELDAQALFYLRSRGIPEPQARELLTAAFARDVLQTLEHPALQEAATQALDAALAATLGGVAA